jgi:phospholipid/cholesterol/gamma-HCH transport system substrate-binding protein
MNERIMQFRVGVMVLATIIITSVLVVLFSKDTSLGTYTVYVRFTEAPGVSKGTPVRKSGIRVGRVRDIQFVEEDRAVQVTLEIENRYRIYRNETCQAVSSLLIGDSYLEFVRGKDGDETLLPPGATVNGSVAGDPTRAIANLQKELAGTMTSVVGASGDLQKVLGRVDKLLEVNEKQITSVISKADTTLTAMQKVFDHTDEILGDEKTRAQAKRALGELPELMKDTRETIKGMGSSIASLETNLHDLEGLTRPLGQHGEAMVRRIDSSTEKLDCLMDKLLQFTRDLNDPRGSLGRLMHDPDMYQHLNHAAKNIDQLTRDLRPIIDDARVFSDKIARHPESLGVRGALQRSDGLK